jgi:predicted ribonuclease toxin of YeeF-YezG toxin-antitoxin module
MLLLSLKAEHVHARTIADLASPMEKADIDSYHTRLRKVEKKGVPHQRDVRVKGKSRDNKYFFQGWKPNRVQRIDNTPQPYTVMDAGKGGRSRAPSRGGEYERHMMSKQSVNINPKDIGR